MYKIDNVTSRLKSYRMTFIDLHIPFLAIAQLYIAFYRKFIASMMYTQIHIPRTFVLGFHNLCVWVVFGILALWRGKSFRIHIKSVSYIVFWGVVQIAMASQAFVRSQIENGPLISACYQPMVPAMSTLAAVFLGVERNSLLKASGIMLWFIAVFSRLIYDLISREAYPVGNHFRGMVFILTNVLFLSTGILLQK